MAELSRRSKALVERGYSLDEVIALTSFTEEELDYASMVAFSRISEGAYRVDSPDAVFVGGQPGSGKSSEVMRLKASIGNAVEVNIDNYRSYHPKFIEIEKCIKKHWEGRATSENDTPGNDIADFTHQFVSDISDRLILMAREKDVTGKSYNMIVEWGMNNAKVPLETMKTLKDEGYKVTVKYVCVHKDISLEACSIRANIILDGNHIIRNIPRSFHEMYVETLHSGIENIYNEGYKNGLIDEMYLVLRNGKIVWDHTKEEDPAEVFDRYLHDPELTIEFKNSREMAKTNTEKEIDILDYKKALDNFNAWRYEVDNKRLER